MFLLSLIATANCAVITGRISMGLRDPVQCGLPYSGDEKIMGYPIVAVDGTSFRSMYDGVKTKMCGRKVKIDGVIHVVVDRVWQNDGVNGHTYNNKYNADNKIWPLGKGFAQFDTATYTFLQRGGNNIEIPVEWI